MYNKSKQTVNRVPSTFLNLTVSLMRCDACTLFYIATHTFERNSFIRWHANHTESDEIERMNEKFDCAVLCIWFLIFRTVQICIEIRIIVCIFFFLPSLFSFDTCIFTLHTLIHSHSLLTTTECSFIWVWFFFLISIYICNVANSSNY